MLCSFFFYIDFTQMQIKEMTIKITKNPTIFHKHIKVSFKKLSLLFNFKTNFPISQTPDISNFFSVSSKFVILRVNCIKYFTTQYPTFTLDISANSRMRHIQYTRLSHGSTRLKLVSCLPYTLILPFFM